MEETDSEIRRMAPSGARGGILKEFRRINEEIRDQKQAMDEVERERMKFIGSGAHDHIRKLDNDIDRKRRDISRNNERVGELMKRMAIMLRDLGLDSRVDRHIEYHYIRVDIQGVGPDHHVRVFGLAPLELGPPGLDGRPGLDLGDGFGSTAIK